MMLPRWKNRVGWRDFVITAELIVLIPCNAVAGEPVFALTATQAQAWKQITDAGLEYLHPSGRESSVCLSPQVGPGITALAVTTALRLGRPADAPIRRKRTESL